MGRRTRRPAPAAKLERERIERELAAAVAPQLALRLPERACDECGRRNYHLESCSRRDPGVHPLPPPASELTRRRGK